MGVFQMGIFCNQTECEVVYQLCSTSSVYPTTLRASAMLQSNNALKWWPCRGPTPQHALRVLYSAHLCYRLFLENVIQLYRNILFRELLTANSTTSRQKCAWQYFHVPANEGLIYTIIAASRINYLLGLSFCMENFVIYTGFDVWTIFWRNRNWNWKIRFFLFIEYCTNKFFNKRIWIIRCS